MLIPDTRHQQLHQLRLSGLRDTLPVRLQEAQANQLGHLEFLELLCHDELAVRQQRQLARRTKAANFRDLKTLDDFDFTFNPKIDRRRVFALATGAFLAEHRDVLLLGPSGTGKSHLAQALGLQVLRLGHLVLYKSIFDVARDFLQDEALHGAARILASYLKVDLLIIDDLGLKDLPRQSGEYLCEIIMRRHQRKSTILTSNRPLEDWGKLLSDQATAAAILDRFLQQAEVLTTSGKSFRLRQRTGRDHEPDVSVKSNP